MRSPDKSAARRQEQVLEGPSERRPFDAAALENDLRRMWMKAREGPDDSGAVYRAALNNFIAAVDSDSAPRVEPVIAEAARRHPSRLISIEPQTGPPGSGLTARIGAVCHVRDGMGGLVCCERVEIRSDRRSFALIPSAVRSLLIGGLPITFLNLRREASPWIDELAGTADLVLEDTGIHEAEERVNAVWRLQEQRGSGCIHDLAWVRLAPWREILAETYDAAEALPSLRTLREVTVRFGGDGRPASHVLLLVGWLASRLGWKLERKDRVGFSFRSETGNVLVALRGEPTRDRASRGAGRIRGVRLVSGAPFPLDAEILHEGQETTAHIHIRGPDPRRMESAFHYREFAACIVGEMHRHGPNRSLEAAIPIAQELMKPWYDA